MLRDYKWEKGDISPAERANHYNQNPLLLLLTGPNGVGKKDTAKMLERKLFESGKKVYLLNIGNVMLGVDADITHEQEKRKEHIRRLAEVAHILMDAGMILIMTADDLTQQDLEIFKTVLDARRIETVWMGEKINTDIAYDYHIWLENKISESVDILTERLKDAGVIFRTW